MDRLADDKVRTQVDLIALHVVERYVVTLPSNEPLDENILTIGE